MSNALQPSQGASKIVTATSAGVTTPIMGESAQIRVCNTGSAIVYIRWYLNTVKLATNEDMALFPGAIEVFTKNRATTISLLSAGADSVVYITPCVGE